MRSKSVNNHIVSGPRLNDINSRYTKKVHWYYRTHAFLYRFKSLKRQNVTSIKFRLSLVKKRLDKRKKRIIFKQIEKVIKKIAYNNSLQVHWLYFYSTVTANLNWNTLTLSLCF